ARSRDFRDGFLQNDVLLRGRGEVEGLLIVRPSFVEELFGVAEELLRRRDDFIDFLLEVGAEDALAGHFIVVGLVDDAAGNPASAFEDDNIGGQSGREDEQETDRSHEGSPLDSITQPRGSVTVLRSWTQQT